MTEFKKLRYTGASGAVVENRFGIWDISAATGSDHSPVRDVPLPDADEMIASTLFEAVGGAVKKDAADSLPRLDLSGIEPVAKPRRKRARK